MKRVIIGMIALATLLMFCVHLLKTPITSEKNKYKVKIGQKFILEKDTLTIINYSSIMETFTLSNGKEVDASIVFNNGSESVE